MQGIKNAFNESLTLIFYIEISSALGLKTLLDQKRVPFSEFCTFDLIMFNIIAAIESADGTADGSVVNLWKYLSIPKLQRLHRWSLGMDKEFHPTFYHGCSYLSMLGLNLIHVGERGRRGRKRTYIGWQMTCVEWCYFHNINFIFRLPCDRLHKQTHGPS